MNNDTKYITHVRKDEGSQWRTHDLQDNLAGTAALAEMFIQAFGNGDCGGSRRVVYDLG